MRHSSTSPYNVSEEYREKELEAERALRVEASKGLRDLKVNLSLYGNCARGGSGTTGSNATSSSGSGDTNNILRRLSRSPTDILVLLCGFVLTIYSGKILYDRFTGRSTINQVHRIPMPMWLTSEDIKAHYILFSAITTEDEKKNIFDEYQLAKSSGVIHPMTPFYTWLDTAHPSWCRGSRYSPQQVVDSALLAAKAMSSYSFRELAVLLSSIKENRILPNGSPNHRMELVDNFVDKCQNLGKRSEGLFGGSFFSSLLGGGSTTRKEPVEPPFATPALQPLFIPNTPASYNSAAPTDIPGCNMTVARNSDGTSNGGNNNARNLMGTRDISIKDVVGEVVEQKAVVDPLTRGI